MKKRITLVLMCLCLMFSCTGCKVWFTDKTNDTKYVDNANALQLSMSQKSADLIEKCNAQYDKMSEYYVTDNPLKALFSKEAVTQSTMDRMQKKADHLQSQVDSALARDTKYQQSLSILKDQENSNSSQKMADLFNKWKFGIAVAIILIIIILVVCITSKSGKNKQPTTQQPASVLVASPQPCPAVAVGEDVRVNYNRLLSENCEKLNINRDEILAKHNGDTKAAYEETNLM